MTSKKTKKEYTDLFYQWKVDGYEVSELELLLEKKGRFPSDKFRKYEENIAKLKALEEELSEIEEKGHERNIKEIKKMLKDPDKVDEIETRVNNLRSKEKEDFFLTMVEDGFKVLPVVEEVKEEIKKPKKKRKKKFEVPSTDDINDAGANELRDMCKELGLKAKGKSDILRQRLIEYVESLEEEEYEGEDEEEEADLSVEMEQGFCYLIEEEVPDKSYRIFARAIENGSPGLCITREYPEKVKKKFGLKDVRFLWLSSVEKEYAIEPTQLGKLFHNIEEFLKKNENAIILISGLEYLISQNNYGAVLKLIQLINDQVSVSEDIMIVPISPSALDKKDLKMIERELTLIKR